MEDKGQRAGTTRRGGIAEQRGRHGAEKKTVLWTGKQKRHRLSEAKQFHIERKKKQQQDEESEKTAPNPFSEACCPAGKKAKALNQVGDEGGQDGQPESLMSSWNSDHHYTSIKRCLCAIHSGNHQRELRDNVGSLWNAAQGSKHSCAHQYNYTQTPLLFFNCMTFCWTESR